PEKNQRSENEVAGYIAEPPGDPNRTVVRPVGKPVQRKAGHAERWADDSADCCSESEFENALRAIKNILAAREVVHQPCTGYSLNRVAGRDGNRCTDVSCGREVYQERTGKDRRPRSITEQEDCSQCNSCRWPHRGRTCVQRCQV